MNETKQKEIALAVNAVAVACQNEYIRRNHLDAPLCNHGGQVWQSDLKAGLNLFEKLSDGAWLAFCEMWDSIPQLAELMAGCPVKKFKRGLQGLLFAATGDSSYIQASVRTAILSLCVALAEGDLTDRVAMVDKLSSRYGWDSGDIPAQYISTAKRVLSVIGCVGKTTIPTQLSVSYGGNSPILLAWGCLTNKGQVNRGNKVLHAIMKHLNRMTDASISSVLVWKKRGA